VKIIEFRELFCSSSLIPLAKMISHMLKSELCANFYHRLSGEVHSCAFGDKCKFAHDPKDLVIMLGRCWR
jgi:hypothetical protein